MHGSAGVALIPTVSAARIDKDEVHLARLKGVVHIGRVGLKGETAGKVRGSVGRAHVSGHGPTLRRAWPASPLVPGAMWVISDTVALSRTA